MFIFRASLKAKKLYIEYVEEYWTISPLSCCIGMTDHARNETVILFIEYRGYSVNLKIAFSLSIIYFGTLKCGTVKGETKYN